MSRTQTGSGHKASVSGRATRARSGIAAQIERRVSNAKRAKAKQGPRKKSLTKKVKKLSRVAPPEDMSLEAWQVALRQQFAAEQDFEWENTGEAPFFSEFRVRNPKSGGTYRVAIRSRELGENFCSCPDFSTNTLGTCKHIEFVLGRLLKKRGGPTALAEGYRPTFSEVYLKYGSQREVRFQPGADCPQALARLASKFFDDEGLLRPDAFERFDMFIAAANKLDPELKLYEDALRFVAELRDAQRRREVISQAFPRGIRSAAFKNLLSVPLYDYQRAGVLFAATAGRALIGDEMGLGKTVQAIGAAVVMARHLGVERVLIVCPASLKHQWDREITRFTDRSAQVIGGSLATRTAQFADTGSFFKIINYDTVHADLAAIAAWSPDLVILDEAQRIKNWEGRTARCVKQIVSPYAIVLTGTPLENRLEELVSLVQFVDKHRLGPTFRFLHEHQIREPETGRVTGYKNLDSVSQTLAGLLLRRRKQEVLTQLPDRLEKNFFVPMTPEQMAHHEEYREVVARIVAKWRRYGFLTDADQRRLMISLQMMRMVCNSTFLLDSATDFGHKADEAATLLDEVYEGPSKAVIFSQWLGTHELLKRRFAQRGWEHVFFHGSVESSKRKHLIDRFREDDNCKAFLATDAGSVGLNLQHASVVINMDLPWNPAVLEQRIGRVHRMGQTQPVQVFNFVSQGTIEEGMLSLLKFKKSLSAGVLDSGDKEVFLGGSRLNRFLQTVEKATERTTAPEPDTQAEPTHGENGAAHQPAENGKPAALSAAVDGRARTAEQTEFPAETSGQGASSGGGDEKATAIAPDAAAATSLAQMLRFGATLLEQLAAPPNAREASSSAASGDKSGEPMTSANRAIRVEQESGQAVLRIALPEPQVLQQIVAGLQTLFQRVGK